jgi:hypothetical protein
MFGCDNKLGWFRRARKRIQPFFHGRIHMTRPAFDLENSLLQNLGGVMNIIGEMVS